MLDVSSLTTVLDQPAIPDGGSGFMEDTEIDFN
jgi:hypothetical protein